MQKKILSGAMMLGLSVLASQATATTIEVDGATTPTLNAAVSFLVSNNLHNDGTPDIINFTTALTTETVATHFDGDIEDGDDYSDDITVNGNGVVLILANSIDGTSTISDSAIEFDLVSNQVVNFNDMTIIPEYNETGGEQSVPFGVFLFDESNDTSVTAINLANSVINMNNVTISGATASGVAADPAAAPGTDITRFDDGGAGSGILVYFSTPNDSDGNEVNLTNVNISHTLDDAIQLFWDSTVGSNTMNIVGGNYSHNIGGFAEGIEINSGAPGTVLNVTNASFVNNETGITVTAGTLDIDVNINEGVLLENRFRNVNVGGGNFIFQGTEANPIRIQNCGNRGIRTGSSLSSVPLISWVEFINNGVYAVELNETDLSVNPVIENCLFVNNGSILAPVTQFRVGDTNSGAAQITFNDSTFHDLGTADFAGSHVEASFSGTQDVTYQFNRVIFSGDGDDYAFTNESAVNNAVEYNDCVFSTGGNFELGAGISLNNVATTETINNAFTDAVQYVSTDADNYRGFDVAGRAGSAGLGGAKKFVPIIEPTGLTITNDGDPVEWFADVASGGGTDNTFAVAGDEQAIYTDPTGDNVGGGAYLSPTDGAFSNTGTDILEVRATQDGTNLYVSILQAGSGAGFGATAETQGALVAFSYDGSGSNQFLFQDAQMTTINDLVHDSSLILNETGAGLQVAGATTGAAGTQNTATNSFEFTLPLSNITPATSIDGVDYIDLIVGLGHTAGNNFRQVNVGAPGAFDGGGGVGGDGSDGSTARLYDLAGSKTAAGQLADYNNNAGPASRALISTSFLTVGVTQIPASVTDWSILDN